MGRNDEHLDGNDRLTAAIKLSVRKVKLNGDYEPNGTYWGCHFDGGILYRVMGDPDEATIPGYADFNIRADDREHAKRRALIHYPNARFYR